MRYDEDHLATEQHKTMRSKATEVHRAFLGAVYFCFLGEIFAKEMMIMQKRRNLAGITIAELCVVIAILTIVSLIVVSFCLLINNRSSAGSDALSRMDEIEALETFVDAWSDSVAGAGAQIDSNECSKTQLVAYAGTNVYILLYEDGVLRAQDPDGAMFSYECKNELSIEFQSQSKEGQDFIVFCKVLFRIEKEGSEKSYTFCSNPRLGESVDNG